jgi:cytosine/adenosine deaminase-related metal-dependent hydrolase
MDHTTAIIADWVLPMVSPPLHPGCILLHGDTVVEMGDLGLARRADKIQEQKGILMPGFACAHTHLELTGIGLTWPTPGHSFTEWLSKMICKIQEIDDQEINAIGSSVEKGFHMLYESGVRVIGDVSTFMVSPKVMRGIVKADTGIKSTVFLEYKGIRSKDAEPVMSKLKRDVETLKSTPSLHIFPAIHALYSTSPELVKAIKEYTKSHHMKTSMHLAESLDEVEFLHSGTGKMKDLLMSIGKWDDEWKTYSSFCAYLETCECADKDTILIHCNHLSPEDIKVIAQKGAWVCLCPESNISLSTGMPDVYTFLDYGVHMCLGTDSLCSNRDLHLGKEMNTLKKAFPDV